ncbi:MAG: aminodeoxychorismate synthase component I [Myxococcota bacterium]|nr:aminodeoxychorismate synthase component I [Myxococcota bacterium]
MTSTAPTTPIAKRSAARLRVRAVSVVSAIELEEPCSPCAAYERFRGQSYPWLLESALVRSDVGRYSFAGASPEFVLRIRDGRVRVEGRRADLAATLLPETRTGGVDPFEVLGALLPPAPVRVPPEVAAVPFLGGAVACLGYELGAFTEPVPMKTLDELGLDDLVALFVDRVVVFDHESQRSWAVGLGCGEDAEEAQRRAERASASLAEQVRGLRYEAQTTDDAARVKPPRTELPSRAQLRSDPARYAKSIAELLQQIELGNVYQVNLTQRIDVPYAGDPWALYRALRYRNPAPFAACIELPEVAVLSSSPERFLRVSTDGRVQSRPIKGTRPRSAVRREDAELAHALAHSPKDRAENLMIADLVRNDLGRVCKTGTVEVPSLMAIEPFASVWQMVSTVEGELREDLSALDLVYASFPPGSMTGAPKIAAMEWIDREEPVRRTLYSGALGYFDARGGIDTSVVIRTVLLKDGCAHLHAGGGVVADSSPEGEYRESLDKASALFDALELADG